MRRNKDSRQFASTNGYMIHGGTQIRNTGRRLIGLLSRSRHMTDQPTAQDTVARFERKVFPEPNSGCWLWMGQINRGGYGTFYLNRNTKAHRVSWILFRGRIPVGASVLHKCDVRSCVNPDHLFVGTHADNMADCALKGRIRVRRGADHRNAKLTDENVDKIRRMIGSAPQKIIAEKFGVSQTTVSYIANHLRYRNTAEAAASPPQADGTTSPSPATSSE